MQPPIRDQSELDTVNVLLDASDGAIIEHADGRVEENKDQARQEFKQETDLHYMLSRFGVIPPRGAPQYGDWDDSVDLQIALESVREARAGYKNLPEELRKKFGSMEELLTAIDNGSLVLKNEEPPKEQEPMEKSFQRQIDELKGELQARQSAERTGNRA